VKVRARWIRLYKSLAGATDSIAPQRQTLVCRSKGNPEMSSYAERASRDHCNVRVLEQVLTKVDIVLQDLSFGRRAADQTFAGRK
jgi:hypothetical protein